MGKLFSGLGFAATHVAGRFSGFARAVIAASATAARSAAVRPVAGNIAPPIGGISRAPEGGWIIATGSVPIVAAGFRGRVTDQGSQSIASGSPSEGGKAVTMPAVAVACSAARPAAFWTALCVCGRVGRFVDPFPRTSSRR
jgi:hypothetical protein